MLRNPAALLIVISIVHPALAADPDVDKLLADARAAFTDGDSATDAEQRAKHFNRAIALATEALKAEPDNTGGLIVRAMAHEELAHYDKAIADYSRLIKLMPDEPGLHQRRGVAHFKAGHAKKSVADFDAYLKAKPDAVPYHWQRGISHYYAGMYKEGVAQFESHKAVNPEDVENAVWHYLCKAKIDGVDKARAALIPIKADPRDWALPVYEMFRGNLEPDALLKQMQAIGGTPAQKQNRLFYTHLYIGLFYEAAGKDELAKKHIDLAAKKYPSDHYMGDVARVHAEMLQKKEEKTEDDAKQSKSDWPDLKAIPRVDADTSRLADVRPPRVEEFKGIIDRFPGPKNQRIVFVVDATGSMLDMMPFVRKEMIEALESWDDPTDLFAIIFYQGDKLKIHPMGETTERNISEAVTWLKEQSPRPHGGGNARQALDRAIKYRASLIFLIADDVLDGLDQDSFRAEIMKANRQGATIHTYQFLRRDPLAKHGEKPTLQLLAEDHAGEYRFVSARDLGLER